MRRQRPTRQTPLGQTAFACLRASLRSLQEDVGPGDKNILAIRQDTARAEYEQVKADLARVRGELRGLKLQVEAAEKGLSPEATVPPASAQKPEGATKDALSRQELARQRLEYLSKLEKLLAADADRLGKEAKVFVRKTLDLIEFQREVDEKEELLRKIQLQAAVLEVELEAPSRVLLIQEAVVNRKKIAR